MLSALFGYFKATALPEQRLEFIRGQSPAEEVPLHLIAPVGAQVGKLSRRFDPLGDHAQIQVVPHGDDGSRDGRTLRVARYLPDKGDVDFQLVKGESFQVTEA